ncbi:mCpol domain-containing protein [Ruegeria sp. AD91A]|uniref:mCpol domain-containing protein n=1 Tax=Ruegeria sp. AD91A TaxID=2293862 RepID=UPI000E4F6C6A|nr:mCpol domain-containing protein [Ruegeria sp. AD91A]AXT27531.1 mCpol domain-containing protein [Ruegeria sp. AD91A]
MPFVTVDGDDIGRRLASCYLSNDVGALISTKELVELKTQQVSELLTDAGYEVLFCAADGVTAYSQESNLDEDKLYQSIKGKVGDELAFSVGIGPTLREAYVALLYAKSTGKARACSFSSMERKCLE